MQTDSKYLRLNKSEFLYLVVEDLAPSGRSVSSVAGGRAAPSVGSGMLAAVDTVHGGADGGIRPACDVMASQPANRPWHVTPVSGQRQ